MSDMNDQRRETWRRVFGVGLIVLGLGLVATFFYPWYRMPRDERVGLPLLIQGVTYCGALIALFGAAGFLGRR